MALVFGAIAPHGGDILAEIADDPSVMAKTRAGMEEMGRRCRAAQPETIVVLTPHGMVVEGAISIGATPAAQGSLGTPPRSVHAAFETDLELVEAISEECAAQEVPLARLVADSDTGQTALPLDWGALIPLWYTAEKQIPRPRVVVLAPDRDLPREKLVRCGLGIARAAVRLPRRVALIASCDQGHAHDPNGPYGYDPASAEHDRAMCALITANELDKMLDWPQSYMEAAKVDAYWQTIMLAGALGLTSLKGQLLSYEAPTYFGMAVAAYE
jgi:aromatic ring-opening dioxygenase LigB subunit